MSYKLLDESTVKSAIKTYLTKLTERSNNAGQVG